MVNTLNKRQKIAPEINPAVFVHMTYKRLVYGDSLHDRSGITIRDVDSYKHWARVQCRSDEDTAQKLQLRLSAFNTNIDHFKSDFRCGHLCGTLPGRGKCKLPARRIFVECGLNV